MFVFVCFCQTLDITFDFLVQFTLMYCTLATSGTGGLARTETPHSIRPNALLQPPVPWVSASNVAWGVGKVWIKSKQLIEETQLEYGDGSKSKTHRTMDFDLSRELLDKGLTTEEIEPYDRQHSSVPNDN